SKCCAKLRRPGSLTAAGLLGFVSASDSGNCEIGRRCLGISRHAATIAHTAYTPSWIRAAGDQMVVDSVTTLMAAWRKFPRLAMSRGALDDSPYCQSACAA